MHQPFLCRNAPVEIQILGDIKRLCTSIDHLRLSNETLYRHHKNRHQPPPTDAVPTNYDTTYDEHTPRHNYYDDASSMTTEYTDGKTHPLHVGIQNAVGNEIFRTLCSVAYAFAVFFFASYTLAVVHDRLPDMSAHPPLPDVFHENIPFLSWAFAGSEYVAGVLVTMWWCIVLFHKHRLIVVRRTCAIAGSVFLLRCATMYVTSMSVPGKHLDCTPTKFTTFAKRARRAQEIFFGMGLSVRGVRTCGDYMFSGHTATLTLMNFVVNEYTPRGWRPLHALCWLLNFVGMLMILAAHEHYSIDVLISYYITSRLFVYYHTLASSVQVRRSDEKRRRIWFPLFWFFEYRTPLVIANEYEWPFTRRNFSKVLFFFRRRGRSGSCAKVDEDVKNE